MTGDENDVDRLTLSGTATIEFKDLDDLEFFGATDAATLNIDADAVGQAEGARITAANATFNAAGAVILESELNDFDTVGLIAAD